MIQEDKKYELLEREANGLCRIKALKDFGNVKKGDIGGYVKSEKNLSQSGTCWVYDNSRVYNNAKVYNNAIVYGNARVCGNARIYGNVKVWGNAKIYGNAIVSGNAKVCSNAIIASMKDYIVFKNWWDSGRYFTWTRSNNMWKVGRFYGTGEELINKAYQDSEESGREYERVVNYVNEILKSN